MTFSIRSICTALLIALANLPAAADEPVTNEPIRILSWNISDDAFVSQPSAFRSLMRWADPDVVLLDEVRPTADPDKLVEALAEIRPDDDRPWNVDVGASGGRQRGVIASRDPLETLAEFSTIVPYPEADRRRILDGMSAEDRANPDWSMQGGIPINGALIHTGGCRLLVVIADLQCCGDGPRSWQEFRRRVEAREIRRLVRRVLERYPVDGLVLAGDFNMVNSTFPMAILTGPYPAPHAGLIPAELYHVDGESSWTWDGRRTPFPSNTLDYQLYGPQGLEMRSGLILDTEALPTELREQFGVDSDVSKRTGRHRPLVVEFGWIE